MVIVVQLCYLLSGWLKCTLYPCVVTYHNSIHEQNFFLRFYWRKTGKTLPVFPLLRLKEARNPPCTNLPHSKLTGQNILRGYIEADHALFMHVNYTVFKIGPSQNEGSITFHNVFGVYMRKFCFKSNHYWFSKGQDFFALANRF